MAEKIDWQKAATVHSAEDAILSHPAETLTVELTIRGYRTACNDDVVIADDVADALLDGWGFPDGVTIKAKMISREKQ